MSPAVSEEPLERRAIISGIGQSEIGRRLGRAELDLTIEAGLRAIADAGLTRDDIDGLSTYPGMGTGTGTPGTGTTQPGSSGTTAPGTSPSGSPSGSPSQPSGPSPSGSGAGTTE